jgi:hypothetical protein
VLQYTGVVDEVEGVLQYTGEVEASLCEDDKGVELVAQVLDTGEVDTLCEVKEVDLVEGALLVDSVSVDLEVLSPPQPVLEEEEEVERLA